MAGTDTDVDDMDAQDMAETFDEEATGGLATDTGRDVFDVITKVGDDDMEGDDDALDADEETDSDLDEIAETISQQDEDDLDDAGSDAGPLASDSIPDFTSDRDFPDEDDEDGVSAPADGDVETVPLGDLDQLGGAQGERLADLESDSLSDSDLVELDYKEV